MFKLKVAISIQSCKPLKLVYRFIYLGRNISSTESDMNIRQLLAWNAIDRLSIIWKSDLFDEMKQDFFESLAVSILLNGGTT